MSVSYKIKKKRTCVHGLMRTAKFVRWLHTQTVVIVLVDFTRHPSVFQLLLHM